MGGLAEFHVEFPEAAMRCPDLSEEQKLSKYLDCIRSDLALAIRNKDCDSFERAMQVALDQEKYAKDNEMNPGGDNTAAYAQPAASWKHKPGGKQACTVHASAKAPPPQSASTAPGKPVVFRLLSDDEKEDFKKRGLCWTSSEADHISRHCKQKDL